MSLRDYGLSPDSAWILKQSKDILWLPPEHRPARSAAFPKLEKFDHVHSGKEELYY